MNGVSPLSTLPRACLGCGVLTHGGRCAACKPKRTQASATQRGYPAWWTRLSKRARELQPWCSTCGTTGTSRNPLTVDHTPEAWSKAEAGNRLTLKDFRD